MLRYLDYPRDLNTAWCTYNEFRQSVLFPLLKFFQRRIWTLSFWLFRYGRPTFFTAVFNTFSPSIKQAWISNMQMAKLALRMCHFLCLHILSLSMSLLWLEISDLKAPKCLKRHLKHTLIWCYLHIFSIYTFSNTKKCTSWINIVQCVNHHSAKPELKVQCRQMIILLATRGNIWEYHWFEESEECFTNVMCFFRGRQHPRLVLHWRWW